MVSRMVVAVLPVVALCSALTAAAATGVPHWVYGQQSRLRASDGGPDDRFGAACALSGDLAIVGAPREDPDGVVDAGAAYVSLRQGGAWSEEAKLVAGDGAAGDHFGASVGVDGDTVVVGGPGHDVGGALDVGAAWVFVRQGGLWVEQAELLAPDGLAQDAFGSAVAVDGDTVLIGAVLGNSGSAPNAGAAYVYVRSGTTWSLQSKLLANDGASANLFGSAVALDGDDAVIGAVRGDDGPIVNVGCAYVFVRSVTSWSQQAKLVASGAASLEEVGSAVDVDAGRVLVGGPRWMDDRGAAWVFVRQGSSWSEEVRLVPPDGAPDDFFGASVALAGDSALVGMPNDSSAQTGPLAGSARLFRRDAGWSEVLVVRSTDTLLSAGDRFGTSVALEGGNALVGAPMDDLVGTDSGSVFALVLRALGDSFCNASDGSLVLWPCGNAGAPDTGCENAQGTGGVRLTAPTQDPTTGQAFLLAEGFPPTSLPGAVFLRATLVREPPLVLGDGLLCLGAPFVRVAAGKASLGTFGRTISHGAGPGTFLYQVWYRSQPDAYCTPQGSNTSNGIVLVW